MMSEKPPASTFAQKCAQAVGGAIGLVLLLSIPTAFAGGVALLVMPLEKTFASAYAVGGVLIGITVTLCALCLCSIYCAETCIRRGF